jgi:RNA polymerase sigma-70 factor (ECF subfamily)
MADLEDDRRLLERIRAGEKAACAECVELHSADIYRLALRLTGDEQEAQDVMQETFLSAFKAIDSFEGRSSLGTWLYRIATNVSLMRKRSRRLDTVPINDTQAPGDGLASSQPLFDWCCLPERDFETRETRAQLEQAIRELPDGLQAAFVLRELQRLSTRESAEVLDLSEDAVKTRLHRARLWLRERLTPYFTERAMALREG